MKTSRKIFIISSSRERVTRAGLLCEVMVGVSIRTTEGEASKPRGRCPREGRCWVALWSEPELPATLALSLPSSSSRIIIGFFPCELSELDERFTGAGELRVGMGSFTNVFGGTVMCRCDSPAGRDLYLLPDLLLSVSWILCRRREQMSLEKIRGRRCEGEDNFMHT